MKADFKQNIRQNFLTIGGEILFKPFLVTKSVERNRMKVNSII